MFAEERHVKILDIIGTKYRVSVKELAKTLNASEATIRRDLQFLEQGRMLKRSHGGAITKSVINREPLYHEKEMLYADEKKYIAEIASKFIEDGDSIILDAGTTTLALCHFIKDKNLNVITNSLVIAYALSGYQGIDLFVTGGKNRSITKALVGDGAIQTLSMYHANKAFMGTNSIDLEHGFTTPDAEESVTKRQMIKSAGDIFFLVDSSKFNKVSFSKVANISEADIIITDKNLNDEIKKDYVSIGATIINE